LCLPGFVPALLLMQIVDFVMFVHICKPYWSIIHKSVNASLWADGSCRVNELHFPWSCQTISIDDYFTSSLPTCWGVSATLTRFS
jgi:hypothetical protein